ncbi:response regulator [bacterium]|nr:MAG: response regulator [bacterium]
MPAGDYSVMSVRDNGAGMDATTRARIFDPFFTTKDPGQGTGLGLSLVYGIVKQSGGAVVVKSEPGEGSTFDVYLPRFRAEAPRETEEEEVPLTHGGPTPRARSSRGTVEPRPATILVVEDEAALRQLAARVLRREGYDVLVADGPEEALSIAATRGASVRLVFSDVVMPKMSGRELVDRLTPLCKSAKVLFTSGYAEDVIARHGVLQRHFLPKPYDVDALTRAVKQLLAAPTK